ncbi:hypothetical protein FB451DRAFT_1185903 [Mycena latifolia]|nr:hypothetical protein FB451DRAFT_1185903 [Mycena latifolia]
MLSTLTSLVTPLLHRRVLPSRGTVTQYSGSTRQLDLSIMVPLIRRAVHVTRRAALSPDRANRGVHRTRRRQCYGHTRLSQSYSGDFPDAPSPTSAPSAIQMSTSAGARNESLNLCVPRDLEKTGVQGAQGALRS